MYVFYTTHKTDRYIVRENKIIKIPIISHKVDNQKPCNSTGEKREPS